MIKRFHTSCHSLAKIIPKNAKGGSSTRWLTRQLADPFIELARKQNFRWVFQCLQLVQKIF